MSVAMTCSGEFFITDGLYDSCLCKVELLTAKHKANLELESDVEYGNMRYAFVLAAVLPPSSSPDHHSARS